MTISFVLPKGRKNYVFYLTNLVDEMFIALTPSRKVNTTNFHKDLQFFSLGQISQLLRGLYAPRLPRLKQAERKAAKTPTR